MSEIEVPSILDVSAIIRHAILFDYVLINQRPQINQAIDVKVDIRVSKSFMARNVVL